MAGVVRDPVDERFELDKFEPEHQDTLRKLLKNGLYYLTVNNAVSALVAFSSAASYIYSLQLIANKVPGQLNKYESSMKTVLGYVEKLQEETKSITGGGGKKKEEEVDDWNMECESFGCEEDPSKNKLTFADVIGMEKEKEQIFSSIVYPIVYPNLYTKTAKGVLLYGPPGTGKTYLIKAAIKELAMKFPQVGVHFFPLTGADLKGKYVGETEKKIVRAYTCAARRACQSTDVFNTSGPKKCKNPEDVIRDAKAALQKDPKAFWNGTKQYVSVIFIDEFDAIGRDRSTDDTGMVANAVNTMLQMMDGLQSFTNIVTVCATNFPWNLDGALIRRFSSQIYCNVPNFSDIASLVRYDMKSRIKFIEDNKQSYCATKMKKVFTPSDELKKESSTELDKYKGNKLLQEVYQKQEEARIKSRDKELASFFDTSYVNDRSPEFMSLLTKLAEDRYSNSDITQMMQTAYNNVSAAALNLSLWYKFEMENQGLELYVPTKLANFKGDMQERLRNELIKIESTAMKNTAYKGLLAEDQTLDILFDECLGKYSSFFYTVFERYKLNYTIGSYYVGNWNNQFIADPMNEANLKSYALAYTYITETLKLYKQMIPNAYNALDRNYINQVEGKKFAGTFFAGGAEEEEEEEMELLEQEGGMRSIAGKAGKIRRKSLRSVGGLGSAPGLAPAPAPGLAVPGPGVGALPPNPPGVGALPPPPPPPPNPLDTDITAKIATLSTIGASAVPQFSQQEQNDFNDELATLQGSLQDDTTKRIYLQFLSELEAGKWKGVNRSAIRADLQRKWGLYRNKSLPKFGAEPAGYKTQFKQKNLEELVTQYEAKYKATVDEEYPAIAGNAARTKEREDLLEALNTIKNDQYQYVWKYLLRAVENIYDWEHDVYKMKAIQTSKLAVIIDHIKRYVSDERSKIKGKVLERDPSIPKPRSYLEMATEKVKGVLPKRGGDYDEIEELYTRNEEMPSSIQEGGAQPLDLEFAYPDIITTHDKMKQIAQKYRVAVFNSLIASCQANILFSLKHRLHRFSNVPINQRTISVNIKKTIESASSDIIDIGAGFYYDKESTRSVFGGPLPPHLKGDKQIPVELPDGTIQNFRKSYIPLEEKVAGSIVFQGRKYVNIKFLNDCPSVLLYLDQTISDVFYDPIEVDLVNKQVTKAKRGDKFNKDLTINLIFSKSYNINYKAPDVDFTVFYQKIQELSDLMTQIKAVVDPDTIPDTFGTVNPRSVYYDAQNDFKRKNRATAAANLSTSQTYFGEDVARYTSPEEKANVQVLDKKFRDLLQFLVSIFDIPSVSKDTDTVLDNITISTYKEWNQKSETSNVSQKNLLMDPEYKMIMFDKDGKNPAWDVAKLILNREPSNENVHQYAKKVVEETVNQINTIQDPSNPDALKQVKDSVRKFLEYNTIISFMTEYNSAVFERFLEMDVDDINLASDFTTVKATLAKVKAEINAKKPNEPLFEKEDIVDAKKLFYFAATIQPFKASWTAFRAAGMYGAGGVIVDTVGTGISWLGGAKNKIMGLFGKGKTDLEKKNEETVKQTVSAWLAQTKVTTSRYLLARTTTIGVSGGFDDTNLYHIPDVQKLVEKIKTDKEYQERVQKAEQPVEEKELKSSLIFALSSLSDRDIQNILDKLNANLGPSGLVPPDITKDTIQAKSDEYADSSNPNYNVFWKAFQNASYEYLAEQIYAGGSDRLVKLLGDLPLTQPIKILSEKRKKIFMRRYNSIRVNPIANVDGLKTFFKKFVPNDLSKIDEIVVSNAFRQALEMAVRRNPVRGGGTRKANKKQTKQKQTKKSRQYQVEEEDVLEEDSEEEDIQIGGVSGEQKYVPYKITWFNLRPTAANPTSVQAGTNWAIMGIIVLTIIAMHAGLGTAAVAGSVFLVGRSILSKLYEMVYPKEKEAATGGGEQKDRLDKETIETLTKVLQEGGTDPELVRAIVNGTQALANGTQALANATEFASAAAAATAAVATAGTAAATGGAAATTGVFTSLLTSLTGMVASMIAGVGGVPTAILLLLLGLIGYGAVSKEIQAKDRKTGEMKEVSSTLLEDIIKRALFNDVLGSFLASGNPEDNITVVNFVFATIFNEETLDLERGPNNSKENTSIVENFPSIYALLYKKTMDRKILPWWKIEDYSILKEDSEAYVNVKRLVQKGDEKPDYTKFICFYMDPSFLASAMKAYPSTYNVVTGGQLEKYNKNRVAFLEELANKQAQAKK